MNTPDLVDPVTAVVLYLAAVAAILRYLTKHKHPIRQIDNDAQADALRNRHRNQ